VDPYAVTFLGMRFLVWDRIHYYVSKLRPDIESIVGSFGWVFRPLHINPMGHVTFVGGIPNKSYHKN
jgi:hypothetical protein